VAVIRQLNTIVPYIHEFKAMLAQNIITIFVCLSGFQ